MNNLLKLLLFIFNFSIYCKIYISDSIKSYFNNGHHASDLKSLKNLIDVFTENKYFTDPGNFLLVELKYNENNKKYTCDEDDLNLEITVKDDNTMIKNFKFKNNNIFQEYKENPNYDEGSLFKITVKDNLNNIKSYYIYSTKLGRHTIHNKYFWVSLENNRDIIEFETIYCFGINIVNDFFKNCKNLKKVKFTNYNKNNENEIKKLINISFHCLFEGCDNLADVNIENLIITNAENMFKDCKKLKNIKFNNSLNNLEFSSTFENCENLENVEFTNPEKNNIIISSNSFKNCKKLQNINVDYLNVFNFFKNCFQDCENLKKIKLVIDESKFSEPYFITKEDKKPLHDYIKFDDSTKNTNLEELEIVTKDNFELTEDNKNHIKKIVKNNKINKFTLNGKSIKVENDCNLDDFISNPDCYLNDNPQYIWKDQIPSINNIDNKINTENIKGNSCLICCGKCCSKCCCKSKT